MAALPTSNAVIAEKRKLRKSLFRWDLILFTVCAIIGLDTLGTISANGPQVLFWLVVSAVTFLVPYGLLTAELGTAFPVEGAAYEWVRMAFGHLAGAVTAVLYWLSNPIWLGGTLAVTAMAALDALWGTSITKNGWSELLVGTVFIWVAITMNILSLRQMKWVPNVGVIVRVLLLGLFLLIAFTSPNRKGGFALGDLSPTYAFFIGIVGVLVFNWVGFELSTNASEEMENPQRDVPRMVGVSGILATLIYGLFIIAILVTLASKDLSNVSGFVTAYQAAVAGAFGGAAGLINALVGAAVVFGLLSSGVVWLMGADRMMAIGALAGSGPRGLGRFSARFGTPVPVNVTSGIVATLFLGGAVLVNTVATGGNLPALFGVVLGLTISTTTFSYLAVFPALVVLRRKYPNATRPYRIGGGMVGVWIVMLLCEIYAIAGTVFSLWPNLFTSSWLGKVSNLDRGTYELTVLLTTVAILALGVVFWAVGRSHRSEEGLPAELVTAERPMAEVPRA